MTEKLTKLMAVMQRKFALTISEQLDLVDEINVILNERQEAKERIVAATRELIQEIGAEGPEDLESVVTRVRVRLGDGLIGHRVQRRKIELEAQAKMDAEVLARRRAEDEWAKERDHWRERALAAEAGGSAASALAQLREDFESLQDGAARCVRIMEDGARVRVGETRLLNSLAQEDLERAVENMRRGGVEGWWRK